MRRDRSAGSIATVVFRGEELAPWLQKSSSRRGFIKEAGLAGVATVALKARSLLSGTVEIDKNDGRSQISAVVKNRAPLAASAFYLLPAGSIQPRGWLAAQLRIQANGLGGHLDETWADVGPTSGWLGGKGESWERGPYFTDGLLPLAYLLNDAALKAKARRFIDWTLDHQAANGMIGPQSNDDWWPRIVMLKALTQFYELTGDARVIPVMDKYFRYQLTQLPARPLRDWSRFRWQDELLSVIWLYNRTGEAYLLELARTLRQQGYDWLAQYADFQYKERITAEFIKLNEGGGLKDLALATHGVNNGQALKTGPVWSLVSGSAEDRNGALKMMAELDRYHGLPNGMFSCDEHLAGLNPSQGSELCTVVEYMFSLEHSLAITGHARFGDRLEKLAFNALPGAFTDDMWAHQYNQESNQVECSLHTKPWTTDGPESNLYGLEPTFGCCTANFHQGWPKFANSLFMVCGESESDSRDGLLAAAYAPCEVRTILRGTAVYIEELTRYPFKESVQFSVNPDSPLAFPMEFRIPGWADGTTIDVNGQPTPAGAPGSFARIERIWKQGDRVEIRFPMAPRVSRWFNNSVSIERGPLVFSFGVGESWVKLRDRGMTADWQVFPTDRWNYALELDNQDPAKSIVVAESEVGEQPFSRRQPPVQVRVKARELENWRAVDGVADPVPQSPVKSGDQEKTIPLIPYAAAKLRITAFPQSGG